MPHQGPTLQELRRRSLPIGIGLSFLSHRVDETQSIKEGHDCPEGSENKLSTPEQNRASRRRESAPLDWIWPV
jgi:hypothetical protein